MRLVAYYRVSTQKQVDGVKRNRATGLGLEAQQAAVAAYVKTVKDGEVVKEFLEVETGKRSRRKINLDRPISQLWGNRPEFGKAVLYAQKHKCRLVIAKLDRLARDVAVTASLMTSGLDFVACDNPQATPLTIHILAAVAQEETRAISERTKAALEAYKERGGLLGAQLEQCRNLTDDARQRGSQAGGETMKQKADEEYSTLIPLVLEMRDKKLQEIADWLNGEGFTTSRGHPWGKVQVMRLLERADRLGIKQ